MYSLIFELLCSSLDLFILLTYFKHFLYDKNKTIPSSVFYVSFVCVELIMFFLSHYTLNIQTTPIVLGRFLLTTLLTFALSCLYETSFHKKIFATITFQSISAIAEGLSAPLVYMYTNFFYQNQELDRSLMVALVSKLLLLIFSYIINVYFLRKKQDEITKYPLLLLLTPFISILVILNTPYPKLSNTDYSFYFLFSTAGLFTLNILNYYLLNNTLQVITLKANQKQLQTQLQFQSEKYHQLSTSYRSTRKLLHDTKKHFFYIQECIHDKQYDCIIDYLQTATHELEHCYSKINTGNLVIDAFVSNYMHIAEQENITFQTDIRIATEQIQTSDYDLCIILGNLLDNSLNACRKIIPPNKKFITVNLFTTPTEFVIHITNSMVEPSYQTEKKEEPSLSHGYGITNIETIVKKNYGTYVCFTERDYEVIITIPIM